MKIERIESVIYGVDDLDTCIRFFKDWGLKESGSGQFTLPSGQTVVIKPASDASLPTAPQVGPTAREVIWGVDSQASLDEIATELRRDRQVKIDSDGTLHAYDDCGFGIGFRRAAPGSTHSAAPKQSDRRNVPLEPSPSVTPLRIGHVVYSIARNDQQKAADFFSKRLQFRITDHTADTGDFMRCNGSVDHHNLFFLTIPNRPFFDHVAFEVKDFDEIIFGGKSMRAKGWKADAAPGRHVLGSNLFWYFNNPAGGNVEYFADMDEMDDDFQTRNWEKSPGYARWIIEAEDVVRSHRR